MTVTLMTMTKVSSDDDQHWQWPMMSRTAMTTAVTPMTMTVTPMIMPSDDNDTSDNGTNDTDDSDNAQ